MHGLSAVAAGAATAVHIHVYECRIQNTFLKLTKTQRTNDNGTSGTQSYLLRTKKRQSETASVMCGHGFVSSGAWSRHAEACGRSL